MLTICNGLVTVVFLCVNMCIFDADECLIAVKLLMSFHIFLRLSFFKIIVHNAFVYFFSLALKGDFCSIYIVGVLYSS